MHQHLLTDADVVAGAATAAEAAAQRAGVTVTVLAEPAATAEAAELFRIIWRASREAAPVSADLMRALAQTGNYVAGAYAGSVMVGASVAFHTADSPPALHSHICGALRPSRNVGFAIKLHQRAWALHRGIPTVTWTVDPLVRRNVYFNLAKLGAVVTDYLPDFYGPMTDGVNAHDHSDRLRLAWPLAAEHVVASSNGEPRVLDTAGTTPLLTVGSDGEPVSRGADGPRLRCEIPADIVRVRELDPGLARAWRTALREALSGPMRDGYVLAGVSRDGSYVLHRA